MILMTKLKNKSSVGTRKRLNPEYKFLILVSAALALAFICSFLFFRLTRVSGESMEPTLYDGDWIVVSAMAYKSDTPQRGDIVVFKREDITNGHIVKRVIGLPGETVEIKQGKVYINGSPFDDDDFYAYNEKDDFGPVVIGDDACFVLGDNRCNSMDSRHWDGFEVSFDEIFGKMIFSFN